MAVSHEQGPHIFASEKWTSGQEMGTWKKGWELVEKGPGSGIKKHFPWLYKLLTFTCCMYKIKLINKYFDIFQLSQNNFHWADFGKVFTDR